MRRDKTTVLVWQLVIIATFFLLWTAVSLSGIVFQRLFPPPWQVVSAALGLIVKGTFFPHLLTSLHEVVLGFCLGAVGGVILGLIFGANRTAAAIFEPIV